jgi:hypothetical protein
MRFLPALAFFGVGFGFATALAIVPRRDISGQVGGVISRIDNYEVNYLSGAYMDDINAADPKAVLGD